MNGKTSKNPHGLYVGQTLLYIENVFGKLKKQNVEIKEIGRKWAKTTTFERVDLQTLQVDGGNYESPGKCYIDELVYLKEQSAKVKWQIARENFLRYTQIPKHIKEYELDMILSILEPK